MLLAVPIAASIAVLVRRLVRYYEDSEFYGAGDPDTSIQPDEAEELARLVRDNPAAGAVAFGRNSNAAPKKADDSPEES